MQDAQVTQASEPALPDEPDKLFGVFHAVGEDLGLNPFHLRVAFLVGLLFAPLAMIAAYVALGAVVALSRLLFPTPPAADASASAGDEPQALDSEPECEPERIAA